MRGLAKLLKHVLAAGNAVNAGSAKGNANALRLSSLLQAARTKGADGKTSLLDGVVGLLLDRIDKKASAAGSDGASRPVDESLDFPEQDSLIDSLDAARGADEAAVAHELKEFQDRSLALLQSELEHAARELEKRSSTDDKKAGEERLRNLHADALAKCKAARADSVEPLLAAAAEVRKYFACPKDDLLDSIFVTLRDFIRALIESRDAQRSKRDQIRRDKQRRTSMAQRPSSTSNRRISGDAASLSGQARSSSSSPTPTQGPGLSRDRPRSMSSFKPAPRPPAGPPPPLPNSPSPQSPRPPSHPPDDCLRQRTQSSSDGLDSQTPKSARSDVVQRAKSRRKSINPDDDGTNV